MDAELNVAAAFYDAKGPNGVDDTDVRAEMEHTHAHFPRTHACV